MQEERVTKGQKIGMNERLSKSVIESDVNYPVPRARGFWKKAKLFSWCSLRSRIVVHSFMRQDHMVFWNNYKMKTKFLITIKKVVMIPVFVKDKN